MYPWRRILVPTDFSTAAEWIFDLAARVAASTNAELLVLHIRTTSATDPGELRFPFDPSMLEYAEQQELELLRTRVEQVHANVRSRMVVRNAPDPGKEISRAAIEEDVDLIVIATHARHHVAHLLIGSTTLEVLRNPPRPVLAVRYGIRKREHLEKLIVPVHSKQTSSTAAKLAGEIGSEVHIVTVCSDEERKAAEKVLDDVASNVLSGKNVKRALIRGTDFDKELLGYANEADGDAIFLNADANSEFSPAKVEMVRNATTPVMIVPATTR